MPVRIYKPSRNAMQSGKAKYDHWIVEFEPASPRTVDPLMGWTSSSDTRQQVKLTWSGWTTSCQQIAHSCQQPLSPKFPRSTRCLRKKQLLLRP